MYLFLLVSRSSSLSSFPARLSLPGIASGAVGCNLSWRGRKGGREGRNEGSSPVSHLSVVFAPFFPCSSPPSLSSFFPPILCPVCWWCCFSTLYIYYCSRLLPTPPSLLPFPPLNRLLWLEHCNQPPPLPPHVPLLHCQLHKITLNLPK